jgi:hypothetical protein
MSSHLDDMNPHDEPPALGSFGRPGSSGLGSLAQSARGKRMKTAQRILIGVGILCLLNFGCLFALADNEAEQVLQAEVRKLGPNFVVQPVKFEEVKVTIARTARLIYAGSMALGVVFIVLGALVPRYPLGTTVIGLVLFIGVKAVYAVFNPANLLAGWLVNVIVLVGLVKAIQSAIAYQREEQAARAGTEVLDG